MYELNNGERIRTCLQCGTCSGICPFGYIMKFPPGKIVGALRADIFDQVLKTDTVWMCVSCNACSAFCPSNIPITAALMTRTKEEMLLAGNIPTELQAALENTQRYGNPMGESPRKRADWTLGLQPEVNLLGKTRQPVDVLWFVGDYASFHSRMQSATKALAKVLNALGVKFGILGPEENSDGDSQRLAGERGLFEMMAQKNGQIFRRYKFDEIITTDPHAFNALKNEYPALGISYPVKHYTQFLFERIEQIKPLLKKEIKVRVAYHDPCYLGRVNGIFDEPRALLEAIPGVELVEMSHQRLNSLCCGGGGGGMWLDGFQWEKAHTRLSEWRVREAVAANAEILAVGCPYEPPRFEDAIKTIQTASQLKVKEIAELLAEAMDL
ncbi:MAG: (Fe-S)-binding protein [Chloroflexota bacterium]